MYGDECQLELCRDYLLYKHIPIRSVPTAEGRTPNYITDTKNFCSGIICDLISEKRSSAHIQFPYLITLDRKRVIGLKYGQS